MWVKIHTQRYKCLVDPDRTAYVHMVADAQLIRDTPRELPEDKGLIVLGEFVPYAHIQAISLDYLDCPEAPHYTEPTLMIVYTREDGSTNYHVEPISDKSEDVLIALSKALFGVNLFSENLTGDQQNET